RIERAFYIAKRFVKLGTEQLLIQVTTCQAISVFAAHATAKFDDEIGNLVVHLLHDLNVARVFGIDHRTDVKTANAGVAVVAGAGTELIQNVPKANEKLRQP